MVSSASLYSLLLGFTPGLFNISSALSIIASALSQLSKLFSAVSSSLSTLRVATAAPKVSLILAAILETALFKAFFGVFGVGASDRAFALASVSALISSFL